MEDSNNFAFFSFNDDFNNQPTPKRGGFYRDKAYKDYREYVLMENDLEAMIMDGIVDISVDDTGIFYYTPSKFALQSLAGLDVKPRESTFQTMLEFRGLNIDKYNCFKRMMRRLSP